MQYKFDLSMFVEERRKKVEQQKKAKIECLNYH